MHYEKVYQLDHPDVAGEKLRRCLDIISLSVREEEMIDVLSDLRARLVDSGHNRVKASGNLLLYDPDVLVSHGAPNRVSYHHLSRCACPFI